MSERDLIQELKSTIKDLSDEKEDLLKIIKTKESRIKSITIKLEHETQDVSSIGHKLEDQNKEIKKLKEKLKDKDKVVEAEIEKYITTHSEVEDDTKEKTKNDENRSY